MIGKFPNSMRSGWLLASGAQKAVSFEAKARGSGVGDATARGQSGGGGLEIGGPAEALRIDHPL